MIDLLTLSIGIGLVVSLVFSDLFGLTAGGMIVPGYIALSLDRPLDVAMTIGAGVVTWGIVRGISSLAIVYGRRRMALMILVGYLVGALIRMVLPGEVDAVSAGGMDLSVIGYIIPGLIALWLDRQGIVETLSALLTAAVVVRLILILTVGLKV
jgi:gamma-polyglutamate biosynthesis protein CapC